MFQHCSIYLLAAVTGHLAQVVAGSGCFSPDGTERAPAFAPCISTENVHSMCCLLNLTAVEAVGATSAVLDTCLPNGLCQDPHGNHVRDSCTDRNWKSPNCLNVCTGGPYGGNPTLDAPLTSCPDGSWCCGSTNTTCCENKLGFQIAPAIEPYSNAVSTSAASSAGSTPTASNAASTSATSTANPKPSGTNHGVEIGLGVALGVVVLAVVVIAGYLYRKRTAQTPATAFVPIEDMAGSKVKQPGELDNDVYYEAPNTTGPAEMDGRGGMR